MKKGFKEGCAEKHSGNRKNVYKEIVQYLLCGIGTTLVDLTVFFVLHRMWNVNTALSTTFAWGFAVLFSYVISHIYVFKSNNDVFQEFVSFFTVRIASGAMQISLMILLCDVLEVNDLFAKLFVGVVVTIINYVASKAFVFKQRGSQHEGRVNA